VACVEKFPAVNRCLFGQIEVKTNYYFFKACSLSTFGTLTTFNPCISSDVKVYWSSGAFVTCFYSRCIPLRLTLLSGL
jgi:hypothetical protein